MQSRALTVMIAVLVGLAAAVGGAARAHAAGSPGGGSCGASGYPVGYDVTCQAGGGSSGSPGTVGDPGGVVNTPCALYPIAGNPTHMLQVCPLSNPTGGLRYAIKFPNGTVTVVPVGGGPPVTPQQLLAWAQSNLALPLPAVRTAPPRGSDGLVGLPEWYWVAPAQWHPMSVRVHVGAVWAQVTAHPLRLVIEPGTGARFACLGPGTAYDPRKPAADQHSSCAYTYAQSSDGLPGNAYHLAVTVVWAATWQGSGGAGGVLAPVGRTVVLALPVAEAQALNPES